MSLSSTTALVNKRLYPDLSALVIGYVRSESRDWEFVARAGEFETCMSMNDDDANKCLAGACYSGYEELVELARSRGANDWDSGLHAACRGGHKELAELMISRGANNWNWGLGCVCRGGHKELAKLMISCGADDFRHGFDVACESGHEELVELMISHGVNDWNRGIRFACREIHLLLKISTDPSHHNSTRNYCLSGIPARKRISRLMISYGAFYCENCRRPMSEHM